MRLFLAPTFLWCYECWVVVDHSNLSQRRFSLQEELESTAWWESLACCLAKGLILRGATCSIQWWISSSPGLWFSPKWSSHMENRAPGIRHELCLKAKFPLLPPYCMGIYDVNTHNRITIVTYIHVLLIFNCFTMCIKYSIRINTICWTYCTYVFENTFKNDTVIFSHIDGQWKIYDLFYLCDLYM